MQATAGPTMPAPPLPTSSMPPMPMFPSSMPFPPAAQNPSFPAPGASPSLSNPPPFPWAPPSTPSPTAFPVLPAETPAPRQAPTAIPIQGASPETAVRPETEEPAAAPAPPAVRAPDVTAETSPILLNPFWFQLGWQLLQTPAARAALGDQFQRLTEGESRMRLLRAAATCLAGPDLQTAFQSLAARTIDQTRFTELFADALKGELQSGGLLPA